MTDREQIIALAKQCGAVESGYEFAMDDAAIEAFFHAAQREALTQAAELIRADKWPTPRSAYHDQYNQQIEALAKRVEQIGEMK